MDRETRKANLKKLQLPGTSAKTQQQRKTRQSTTTRTTSISNYFPTPEKTTNEPQNKLETPNRPQANIVNNTDSISPSNPKTKRAKRTKLDAFLFKEPQHIPKDVKTEPICLIEEDFDVPEKKAKKAPQLLHKDKTQSKPVKSSKRKKQTTIKSAFLRNEQLFAEIAAQHCAADNFDGDDVQLAIAISKSEAEVKGTIFIEENALNDNDDVKNADKDAEQIRQQLEKYGFRTAEKKDYNTFAAAFMPQPKGRRQKSKWANKFTALTLRDEEVQCKRLQQKIEDLLNQQFRTHPLKEEDQKQSNYLLQSSLLKKYDQQIKGKILQLPENVQIPHNQYFVEELFEISKLSPGHLLKDWRAIQGRDLTPKKQGPYKEGMAIRMRQIYADLEKYFHCLKSANKSHDLTVNAESTSSKEKVVSATNDKIQPITNENPTISRVQPPIQDASKAGEHNTSNKTDPNKNNLVKNYFMPFQEEEPPETITSSDTSSISSCCQQLIDLIPPTKSLDLMQVSFTSIRSEAATFNSTQDAKAETSQNSKTTMDYDAPLLNRVKDIVQPSAGSDVMQISSTSLRTEATINSTQKTRSNSPDLFADSDVEMEENENIEEGLEVSNDLSVTKRSRSIDNMMGVSTYEIYSSDEVKNTLLSEVADRSLLVKEKLSASQSFIEENVIDLTQDDGGAETSHETFNRSNHIVEVDLFADSPLNDAEPEIIDINSNSQKSKYLPNAAEETFKVTLSLEENDDATNFALGKHNGDTFKFTFSMEADGMEDCDKDEDVIFNDMEDCDNDEDGIFNNSATNQANPSFLTFRRSNQTASKLKENVAKQCGESSFQLSPSQEVEPVHECDDDDLILRDIAINQTNTSFLNFQGPKQLESSFHRETATEPKVSLKRSFAGNDTIFRELYNKYLGTGAAKQDRKSLELNESNALRKSFSQALPKVVTPQREHHDIKFSMDMDATIEYYMANRKSLSFNNKTPERTFSRNTGLSKSQSFTEPNISIDLTQNAEEDDGMPEEEDDYDDCLVLSDDEINYSIWKSKKSDYQRDSNENSDCEDSIKVDDFDLNKNNTHEDNDQKHSPLNIAERKRESSLLDILNKEPTPPKKLVSSQSSYSDFELQSPKMDNCKQKLERSNFGILEEFSEPIDYTPNLSTPTKVLSEASFLQSPSELTEPMKRYSNGTKSTQKFNDLLKSIDTETEPYNNVDDFDAFDYMIYQNQVKKTTSAAELPQGFEQLMTAEISFKESQTKSLDNNRLPSTDLSKSVFQNHSTQSLNTKLKTPVKSKTDQHELTINNKTYTICRSDAVKPNFAQYTEAELLKELYNYGIKPLKRKQAVKMLEYIYIQTHPIIVDEPTEDVIAIEDFKTVSTSKSGKTSKISFPTSSQSVPSKTVTSVAPTADGPSNTSSNKLDLQDGCGMNMLRYSLDLKAELLGEQYILQTNVSKKTPQPLMPFHIAWYNLVCSNPKLHENILMYEPIDLQEIYLFLKGLGYRYDPKDLKQFFDRRCIIFRYDLAAAGSNNNKVKESNRHVRKKKKTSTKSQQFA